MKVSIWKVIKSLIVFLFIIHSTSLFSQEKLYRKGTLFASLELGFSYNKVKNHEVGRLDSEKNIYPSGGFGADYNFAKTPFGLNTGVNFNVYSFRGLKVTYLSIPLQANVRFGKRFQFYAGVGLSQNFMIRNRIDVLNENFELFNNSREKYSIGLVETLGLSYSFKEGIYAVGFNVSANQLLNSQFEIDVVEKIGASISKMYLSGYSFSLNCKYRIFNGD